MAVTIKDVAKEAGTSISTVSKALNDSYTISEETKRHVKQVARQLGYHPNIRAQTLARKVGKQTAFLTHLPRDIGFSNPHMFEILAGAENALAAKDYTISLHGCSPKNVCFLAKDIIERKSADGLLLHASVVTKELALMISRHEMPHIVIGTPQFNSSRLCWIDIDNHLAGEIAARHIIETGHKKIAFMGGYDEDMISRARLDGVLAEFKESGLNEKNISIYKGQPSLEAGGRMLNKMLKSSSPDAIICSNNYLAFGCLNALKEKGINVPGEVSVITFDSYPFAQITQPKLSTVSIDVFEMGQQAGKLLINKIKKPNLQVQSFTTLPNLIIRESTR